MCQATDVAVGEGVGAVRQYLLGKSDEDVSVRPHGPGEARERDIDRDQGRGQERYVTAEQAKARIDVAREGVGEAVDDGEVGHDVPSSPAAGVGAAIADEAAEPFACRIGGRLLLCDLQRIGASLRSKK